MGKIKIDQLIKVITGTDVYATYYNTGFQYNLEDAIDYKFPKWEFYKTKFNLKMLDKLGKTIFLTKSEVEAELKIRNMMARGGNYYG